MTFLELLEKRLDGQVLIICSTPQYNYLYSIDNGDTVPEETQRDFWRWGGGFYVLGGLVRANEVWAELRDPDTPETRALFAEFKRPVTQAFLRPTLVTHH